MSQRLTEDSIQRVKDADIVSVIGRRMELKKAGPRWSGPCPFHDEKTDSFKVTPAKGMFKCFGCNKGGGVISFVMEFDKLEYIEAVKAIAAEENINLVFEEDKRTEVQKKEAKEKKSIQTQLYDLNQWAMEMYVSNMTDEAMEALLARGPSITEEVIKKWNIGYAPNAWKTLTGPLSTSGRLELGIRSGLISTSEKNGEKKHFDFFRDRVMIPIMDDEKRVISFGGWNFRWKKGDSDPKYLNGRESLVYEKQKVVFGIYGAKDALKKLEEANVAEGYFDVISAQVNGLQNTVGTCGTALTEGQIKILKRYGKRVTILQDNDDAGIKSSLKDVDLLLAEGMLPRVAFMPAGKKDIDDVFNKK
jgi:DNA primase